MTKLIDAELIIEELEKIIQLVKDADGVKVVPLVENALDITSEYLRTVKEQNIIMVKDHGKRQQKELIEKFRQLKGGADK